MVEALAVVFSILSVWFTAKQNIWCWPTGLIGVVLYFFVFRDAKLYSDAGLQVIYVFLQVYGWHHWLKGGLVTKELPVTTLTPFALGGFMGLTVFFTTAWGAFMHRFTTASAPVPDAFIVGASLVAQYLLTRKKLESWIFWIAVDVVGVPLYFSKGLYVTAGLYLLFLVLAIGGFVEWRRSRNQLLEEVQA